jgi:membrane protease YdiL (CAAX protease family)
VVQTVLAIWVAVIPTGATVALVSVAVLQVALLLFVLVLRLVSGREAVARAGLAGGRVRYWALFGLAFVLFFALQSALNLVTGLGKFPSNTQQELVAQGIPGEVYPIIVAVVLLTSIFVDPVMSMGGGTFGEEYGWRGYLQGELVKAGKRRGVLLVGLIWAVWHYPIILVGRHAYPASALGLLLMAGFCVLLGFVLGYAMLKAGSVWLAAYLHGLANTLIAYMFGFIAQPSNIAISFGMGALGLACAALVVLAISLDPVWRSVLDTAAIFGHGQDEAGELAATVR